jgi:hypothetical protein
MRQKNRNSNIFKTISQCKIQKIHKISVLLHDPNEIGTNHSKDFRIKDHLQVIEQQSDHFSDSHLSREQNRQKNSM